MKKGFILIGANPGGLPTAVGIIDDENGDIGLVVVAQVVNFIHVNIGLVGKAPQMHKLITRLDIVGLIGMDQAQLMWPIPLMRKHSLPPAVVHHACAKANFSLVHEIGHLIGASHERGYVHGNEWPRLPVWSNPDVLIGGAPAGSVGHDNARVIADNVLRVAAFR